jgi:uncharacterized protein
MTDFTVYLEKLSLFGSLLRKEGLDVTPRETEDACRALFAVGMESRETVKAALSTVYAHSVEDLERFEKVFDGFFLSEEKILSLDKKHREQEFSQAQAREQAERDLQSRDGGSEYSEAQKDAFASLPEEEKERLLGLKEKYIGEGSRNPELYGNFIHSIFARSILERQMQMEDAALGGTAKDPELGLMFRDITAFEDREIPKAVSYIRTIAEQINGELTRRRARGGHTGVIDFRRTIRAGLETGGSLYRLYYRKKRTAKRQFVVLCDVSGSMLQFSEFMLRFIQSLHTVSDYSRIFLFSEEMIEADPFELHDMDRFRDYVKRSGIFGRGTDLGGALRALNAMRPAVLNSSTLLLIISDTKTVDRAGAERELLRAGKSVGKMFFLNPIPERKWQYIQSVRSAMKICPMIPCSTLDELGAACRRIASM